MASLLGVYTGTKGNACRKPLHGCVRIEWRRGTVRCSNLVDRAIHALGQALDAKKRTGVPDHVAQLRAVVEIGLKLWGVID
jgi:hypothetical protein